MLHRRAADYLAYTHVTGWRPTHLRTGTSWSTSVLLGTLLHPTTARWIVDEQHHTELADHPFVKLFNEYKAKGFTLTDRSNWKRRLISRGIPMLNDDTGQEIAIHANGKVVQHHAPGGKWQYIPDLRKAQHA
jgi:hypothetical protein